jgi:signal peptidase I
MPITPPDSLSASESFSRQPSKQASKFALLFQQFRQGCALLVCALASYLLISHFCVQSVRVVGLSMLPTLRDSQFYLLNRWVLHFRPPQPSEIVVLRDPLDGGFAVKRVVAVAGDSVYLANGVIFVNGKQLSESYLPAGTKTFTTSPVKEQLFTCGVGQFFVLGDNRGNSLDSRTYGPVSRGSILGLIVR